MVEVWEVVEIFRFGRWVNAVVSGVGEKTIAVRRIGRDRVTLIFGDPRWSTFRKEDDKVVVGVPIMISVGENTEYAVVSEVYENSVVARKLVKDFKTVELSQENKKWRRLTI